MGRKRFANSVGAITSSVKLNYKQCLSNSKSKLTQPVERLRFFLAARRKKWYVKVCV